jgi:molybdate-binding protein
MNKLIKLFYRIIFLCLFLIITFSCTEISDSRNPGLVTVYQVAKCPICIGNQRCNYCENKGVIFSSFNVYKTAVPTIAENASYYGELNENGIPKTVFVNGYFRTNGTYVKSYYRSPSTSYVLDNVKIRPFVVENGSYKGEISETTGRPKTVPVDGYYRKDGTYVKGHYRSSPSRRK